MQVYSVVHLCLGIFVGGVGIALLLISLLAAVKRKKFKTYEDRKTVYSSLFCTFLGVYWTSSAFDLPHQTSQRTGIIFYILLAVMFVTFITSYLVMRRLTKDPKV